MNRLTIIGNLTKDPEVRTTTSGKTVCGFTVAVNRRQKKEDGKSEADFFNVSAWNELGEICSKYLAKGRKVAVVGSVSVHAYKGNDGNSYGSLDVMATEVEFLTPRGTEDQRHPEVESAQPEPPKDAQTGMVQTNPDDLPF